MSRSRPWQASSDADAADMAGFAEAFRAAGIGAWDWSLDSGVLKLDEAAMALMGIDSGTFDGLIHTWTSLVHPDDYPRLAEETRRAMCTVGPFSQKYRICRQDGSTQWVQSPGPGAGGRGRAPAPSGGCGLGNHGVGG